MNGTLGRQVNIICLVVSQNWQFSIFCNVFLCLCTIYIFQNTKLDLPASPCPRHLCHPPGMLLRMLLLPGGVARNQDKDWNVHLRKVQ
ncbi:hypothetical protein XENTR_v10011361 [Xenopus tropicalis]|nr:hypothetical protein XENTR_v10011361 [Xenopus tropicalis]